MRVERILVTSGAGFLGSHLCERLLADGHSVICVDDLFTGRRANIDRLLENRRFDFLRHDVNEPFTLEVDRIYHLACPASPVHYQRNPARTIRTCVQGTLRALECARGVGARPLLSSTSEVHGDPTMHPQVESYHGNVDPIGDRACYDEGKRCAEVLAVSCARPYDVGVRIARIFSTYGPSMQLDDGRVVSNFIAQSLSDQPVTIHGDGKQTRWFGDVCDLTEALVRFMGVDTDATPLNLANPTETTMADTATTIRTMCGSNAELVRRPSPSDDRARRCPKITRARELLGWEPKVPLATALVRTIADFRGRAASESWHAQ